MLSSTNGIDSTGNAQIVAVTGGGGATLEENATSETTTTEKAKSSFPELEIFTLVKEMVDGTFNEITTYQHSKISAKNEELSAKIVQQLARLPNKYKFVGNLDTEKVKRLTRRR